MNREHVQLVKGNMELMVLTGGIICGSSFQWRCCRGEGVSSL